MTEYQFGRLEDLGVKGGQPAPDQRLRIVRAARFGKEDERKLPVSGDPEPKRLVWDLMDQIERIRDGCIVRLEFRWGLPYLIETTVTAAVRGLASVHSGSSGGMP